MIEVRDFFHKKKSMDILVISRQTPTALDVHKTLLETLKDFLKNDDNKVVAIFFTEKAVSIASSHVNQMEDLKAVQEEYRKFSKEYKVDLLVCGRAYMEAGLNKDHIDDDFSLSGNMELSLFINAADKVLEI